MSEKNEEGKEITVTGYLGKNFNYKFFDDTNKSIINASLKPLDENSEWLSIKAFNANAERLKECKVKGISKVQVTGVMKTNSYTNKKNEIVSEPELQVKDLILYQVREISGVVTKLEEKETTKGKKFYDLLLADDTAAGQQTYNVTLWADRFKEFKEVGIAVGKPAFVKGEVSILENKERSKEFLNMNAWNVAKTKKDLAQDIESKQAKGTGKKVAMSGAEQSAGIGAGI
jgi:single-stranded DNA-binding protein